MKKSVFVSLIILGVMNAITAQQAVFVADSSQDWMKYAAKEVAGYEWRIQGQTLRFGSEPIKADINLNVVDTVFFRSQTRFQWDTILCIIDEPNTYLFQYNECCSCFNVMPADSTWLKLHICFRLTGNTSGCKLLGTIDECGLWVTEASTDTMVDFCRSAMKSSCYNVSLRETQKCIGSDCISVFCMYEDGKINDYPDYDYEVISSKFRYQFIPLSNRPVYIYYDPEQDIVRIRP